MLGDPQESVLFDQIRPQDATRPKEDLEKLEKPSHRPRFSVLRWLFAGMYPALIVLYL